MRRFFINSILIMVSLAIALGLVEIAVRLFSPEAIRPRFTVDLGHGIRGNEPNLEVTYFVPGQYEAVYHTNSVGMRGRRDYETTKPADVCRVAVVGDSFAFGEGVADGEVVTAVLEETLNRTANGTVFEVLNFGIPGIGTAEELVLYQNHVRSYRPDLVAVLYFNNDTGNSLVSGLYELDDAGNLVRAADQYIPGVEVRAAMHANPILRWLSNNSQAWNLVRNRLSAFIHEQRLAEQGLGSYDAEDPQAVKLTRQVFVEFVNVVAADDAAIVVFAIPDRDMTSNFPLTAAELEAAGAVFIDGRNVISTDDYYTIDGHWRETGHAKAATAVADVMRAGWESAGGACRLQ
ncbi:MAG: hypothetical protein GY791_06480 [Alphaproteobacteria bacterium]|nr:hypothetical protein [Alphaproteobacteria bacterium]